jgi:hypothetical protein
MENFKKNINQYQKGTMTPSSKTNEPAHKFNKMLTASLRSNASMLESLDDPFSRTSCRKKSPDSQLWQLLDKLKIQKGEQLDSDNLEQFKRTRQMYV